MGVFVFNNMVCTVEYRVTIKDYFYQLGWTGLYALVFAIYPLYVYFKLDGEGVEHAILAALFIYLIQAIPHLIIFCRYLYLSYGRKLYIGSNQLIYECNGIVTAFALEDIVEVVTTESKVKNYIQPRFFPWDSFCFSIIKLRDGKELLVTHLMLDEMIWPINMPNERFVVKVVCWV